MVDFCTNWYVTQILVALIFRSLAVQRRIKTSSGLPLLQYGTMIHLETVSLHDAVFIQVFVLEASRGSPNDSGVARSI